MNKKEKCCDEYLIDVFTCQVTVRGWQMSSKEYWWIEINKSTYGIIFI